MPLHAYTVDSSVAEETQTDFNTVSNPLLFQCQISRDLGTVLKSVCVSSCFFSSSVGSIYPLPPLPRPPKSPLMYYAGANISQIVMSHLDRTFLDNQRLLEFAKRGCYLEYDLFGFESSHYQVDRDNKRAEKQSGLTHKKYINSRKAKRIGYTIQQSNHVYCLCHWYNYS